MSDGVVMSDFVSDGTKSSRSVKITSSATSAFHVFAAAIFVMYTAGIALTFTGIAHEKFVLCETTINATLGTYNTTSYNPYRTATLNLETGTNGSFTSLLLWIFTLAKVSALLYCMAVFLGIYTRQTGMSHGHVVRAHMQVLFLTLMELCIILFKNNNENYPTSLGCNDEGINFGNHPKAGFWAWTSGCIVTTLPALIYIIGIIVTASIKKGPLKDTGLFLENVLAPPGGKRSKHTIVSAHHAYHGKPY